MTMEPEMRSNPFKSPADARVVLLLKPYQPKRGGWFNAGERTTLPASEADYCIKLGIATDAPAVRATDATTDKMISGRSRGEQR
jgi:hypothetical protein